MSFVDMYYVSFLGVWLIITTWFVQGILASFIKAGQKGAVPGKIDSSLSHSSLVFRSYRTFMNSNENVPLMLATIFFAVFINVNASWLAIYVWVFALARLIHMILYYAIATEKNPSPRSYFYLIGLIANIALIILCAIALLTA